MPRRKKWPSNAADDALIYGTKECKLWRKTRQHKRCRLCQRHLRLVIDHDHKTGAVRGLICQACNLALQEYFQDPAWRRRAIRHVKQYITMPNSEGIYYRKTIPMCSTVCSKVVLS